MLFFTSMIILLITGFAVYFPHSWVEYLGSYSQIIFEYRTLIHRIAALVFIFTATHHLIYIIKAREGRALFHDLLPKWRDVLGPVNHLLKLAGINDPRPAANFEYHEKLEYWLTFIGTVLIIITGVILWLEDYFSNLELDISLVIHFYAGLLALLGMVVWNFTNLHPEFYFYRKEEELPCSREECVQCDACLEQKDARPHAWTYCLADNSERARAFLKRGVATCAEAQLLITDGSCQHSCLELATCASVCLYGSRIMNDEGLLELENDNCVGCGMCARECPTRVISMMPRTFFIHIMCHSQLPKFTASLKCPTQCRRCMMCQKRCPKEAISFNGHLPVIDYRKCISCGLCVSKCPVNIITDDLYQKRLPAEISEGCKGCGLCLRVCPVDAISGYPKERHVVDPQKCIACGLCVRTCKQSAVRLAWIDELVELVAK